MSSCEEIIEIIPEYFSGSTTIQQNTAIARHISSCLSCKADFALWLSVASAMRKKEEEAPSVNYQALFSKLPEDETELNLIINSGTYNMAMELIRYAFSTVKSTYRLAGLI